ncbi:MAG: primosomal protein N' [Cytophagaceae bacterium]|jgi:primosomal protein N' (replication factor Y)|nr:primosomal protein N' [Cytophagaceae bacterium]
MLFCDVLLPLPLAQTFTYRIPDHVPPGIERGMRVIVPFGAKKITTAVVLHVHNEAPQLYTPKPLIDVLDPYPSITSIQLQLIEWMAQYYMCTMGEVLQAVLPSGLKISSESIVQLHPLLDTGIEDWNEQERAIVAALRHKDLSLPDIAKILGTDKIHSTVKRLIQKQAILLIEEIKERYKPKSIVYLQLAEAYVDQKGIQQLLTQLEKKPKQQEIILRYLQEVPIIHHPELNQQGCEKKYFLELIDSTSSLQTLLKKGILKEREVVVHRHLLTPSVPQRAPHPLSAQQQKALEQIITGFAEKDTVVFHGVTGSGKTEVYIDLIQKTIDGGSQALYLLPEIALTTQMVDRLQSVFGKRMGIYHSRFSDNERVDVWKALLENKIDVVVGVRSSIFLPYENLGLIIIDEEHEASYKQNAPAPRYHARDTALVLAKLHHAKTLIGSATPSVESMEAAYSGRWGYVTLLQRHEQIAPPEIQLIPMRIEAKQKSIQHGFSLVLTEALQQNKEKGKQSIVFQNRRGFAPVLKCEDCGAIPECKSCSVPLTYHQFAHELRCHYCGFNTKLPKACTACGSTHLHYVGAGTERIEEDLKYVVPTARVVRMDLDTTRKKNAFSEIFQAMAQKEIDILVGTQMVTKGLDFEHVEVVAVYDADKMLYHPDFRSMERARQQLIQVSGRAGRRSGLGKVYIQTYRPEHPIFEYLDASKTEAYYLREFHERKLYGYPPYTRMIQLSVLHLDRTVADQAARRMADLLQRALGTKRVLSAHPAFIEKLRNYYHFEIFIKLEKDLKGLQGYKQKIQSIVEAVLALPDHKKTRCIIDVDPL